MNKSLLDTFIRKYYLGGTEPVESVMWTIKNKQLFTRFSTNDGTVIGEVTLKSIDLEDAEVGIYTTSQLQRLLGVMLSEVDISFEKFGDKYVSMQVTDGQVKINYMVSEKNVISKVPSIAREPEYNISILMDKPFMERFIKSKIALPEADKFTFLSKDGKSEIVIGYAANINSNHIRLGVDCECGDVTPASFKATYFKEILVANREAESATLNICSEGLAKITFDINDFISTYYLVEIRNNS